MLASDNKEKTEIVTPNPITESYNVKYGNVKIKKLSKGSSLLTKRGE